MRAADIAPACALLNDIIARGGTTAHEDHFTEAGFAAAFPDSPDTLACTVVLDPGGVAAGFQWLGRDPRLPPDCGDIATFTRRAPRLPGAGRALFAATLAAARTAGLRQINAMIRADNRPGLGYYAALGFRRHSVTPAVPLRDGRPVDRIATRYTVPPG